MLMGDWGSDSKRNNKNKYNPVTPAWQQNAVATEFAKQEALGIEPSKEVQNNIERAEKWGDGDWMAGIADILKANALTYTVKGDLIPGTKDKYYDGSRKRNCISALVDAGYSQYQAMQLYDLLNG